MDVGLLCLFVSFMTLLSCSQEGPIEGSTLPPEPDVIVEHQHGSHIVTFEDKSKNGYGEISDEENNKFDQTVNRSNHSRMLTLTTTLGYDEWWFLTTRRPQISLKKDFPGRPGVATWKEISPSSSVENRKSRKITGPQAAGVSSGSWSFALNRHYSLMTSRDLWMLFLFFCFCWT